MTSPADIQRLLIRTPNWLGDNILALPAVQEIQAILPHAYIATHTREPMHDLWSMTDVDEVLSLSHHKGIEGLRIRWRCAREIAEKNFDAVLILPNSFDSALIPWCAKIPNRIGWPTDGRKILLTDSIERPDCLTEKQQWLHYVYLVRKWLGQDTDAPASDSVRLHVTTDAKEYVAAECKKKFASPSSPLLTINPGATYGDAKQWLPDRFAAVALYAHNTEKMSVVLVGGPGDVDVCNTVKNVILKEDAHADEWCASVAGKTTIPEFAAWLNQSLCTVTNDTGGMHVSAAVGTPVVAIFGPTDWRATAPLGDGHILITNSVDCSPCFARTCTRDHECMKATTADEVSAAVHSILSRNS